MNKDMPFSLVARETASWQNKKADLRGTGSAQSGER
jgi:hypothetical protein